MTDFKSELKDLNGVINSSSLDPSYLRRIWFKAEDSKQVEDGGI
jgi:hypothetical protein